MVVVVVTQNGGRTAWTAELASSGPVDRVEVVVNGSIVDTLPGLAEAGHQSLRGEVEPGIGEPHPDPALLVARPGHLPVFLSWNLIQFWHLSRNSFP